MSDKVLDVKGLKKTYPGADKAALNGIDVWVEEGEVFGFLGPNGAGKTTAISIMCTLLYPDEGSVTICGHDALRRPRRVKPLIGLVPQDIALYPTLTARENLKYFGRLFGLRGSELNDRVDRSLSLMGLQDHGDRRIDQYSGGMKRRANLAAGILHEPKVLFLDEPTVGIDAQSRNMILDNLMVLLKEGITMIYTSHYMEEVQRICSRICIIDYGSIIACGEPQKLVDAEDDCRHLEDLFLKHTGHQLRD